MVGFLCSVNKQSDCYNNRGETFRTAFRQIGGLRALTNAPFMALTASAPPSIEAEITSNLEMHAHDCITVSLPLDRPNIYMSTKRKCSFSVSLVCVL